MVIKPTDFAGNATYKRPVVVHCSHAGHIHDGNVIGKACMDCAARTTHIMSSHVHRTHRCVRRLCILLAVLAGVNAQSAHAATSPQVIISAVLPNPSSGPEWVMIEYRDPSAKENPLKLFLPWIAIGDAGTKPIDKIGPPPTLNIINIAGWQLGNGNTWYTVPQNLPPLRAGAKVIVYYDGLGASHDDDDLSDGTATLHTPAGMTNVLPDTKGVILLYAGDVNTTDNLRAKYEWGVGIE